ncbi:class I lanthipeptide [Aquimarina sp. 2201CG1-2-11]|uniref:class I lanthipeptide n=1 Tax=Aquimarina discodermiae TaxID=3231043 RepID=UPI0034636053
MKKTLTLSKIKITKLSIEQMSALKAGGNWGDGGDRSFGHPECNGEDDNVRMMR